MHTASSKKNYSFSFKSLMKILYFFKPVLNVFQKKNCPIIMTISSLCKKCNFSGKGYILEFRAFGSKMKIKKNFTCTYIKRKQISTCMHSKNMMIFRRLFWPLSYIYSSWEVFLYWNSKMKQMIWPSYINKHSVLNWRQQLKGA